MAKCEECGSEVLEGSRHCVGCGAVLEWREGTEADFAEYVAKYQLRCEFCGPPISRFPDDFDFESHGIRILRLRSEYDDEAKVFRVGAEILFSCPNCGKASEGLVRIRDIPIEFVRELCGKCPACGSKTELGNRKLAFRSSGKFESTVDFSGVFHCTMCRASRPFRKKFTAALRPVAEYIRSIRKAKIGLTGVEWERLPAE